VKLKYYLIFLIAICSGSIFAESPHSIHWKKIDAASGYSVEIKTESNKSIFRNTTEPSVTVLLSVGKYSYRIGIYNKLKRIAKWSDWYELEVRPVRPPVVTEQVSEFETDGSKRKLKFSGENIFEGTSAYVIQDGNKIPAEVTTSRDRKTSVVSVDAKLVDINKDYKVILVNPNFESIEVPLIEKEVISDTEDVKVAVSKEDRDPDKKIKTWRLWPLFWRQALLPGWGHYYMGNHLAAYSYWSIIGASTLYTAYEYKEYASLLSDLQSYRESMKLVRAFDPDGLTVPFFAGSLSEEKYSERITSRAESINQAISFIGAVYVTSLVHIVYSGLTKKTEDTPKQSFNLQIRPDIPLYQEKAMDLSHTRVDFRLNFYY
jgi:hypothetical protein